MRKLQIALFALLIVITGCKKEEIITITKSSGKVVERSTNAPLSGVRVSVTNGQRVLVSANTDTEGRFEFDVDFDKVTASDSLLLDGSPDLPSKRYELKGMGKETYSYGTLWLYDKNDNTLLPQATTDSILSVGSTTAVIQGTATSNNEYPLIERGVCYAIHQTPTLSDSLCKAGAEQGNFICELTELELNTTYYVRAYATNSIGTVYGAQMEFATVSGLASVVTANASNVTETSAVLGGEVVDDGGYDVTSRGVCYATHSLPTLADNTAFGGSGIGSFSCEVQNLTPLAVYYYRAFAINAIDTVFGEQKSFTAINGMPKITTSQVAEVLPTSATGGGIVTDDGGHNVTERGVCWSTDHNPDLDDNKAHSGTGVGSYSVQMTGLAPATKYYVRAYAQNSEGVSFGGEVSFTTPGISIPTVNTQSVTNITRTTAIGGGVVSSDGGAAIIERGICWSTNPNPTISGSHATNGVGEGSYTVQMTGLTPNTTYYVKAYAINSQGIGYGEEKTFRTENISNPLVTTANVSNITQTTAMGGGNVTDEGGGTVTERGICWSLTENPTIQDNHASNGGGTGLFTVQMTGLVPGTTYHVRAYAKNATNIGYGDDVTFETQPIQKPTVSTSNISNIGHTTATGGGNVTSDGGAAVTERGICWNTSPNPTINDSHAYSGMGIGTFSVEMTGLTPGTAYYVRAYAKNSAEIGYGSDVVFTTLSISEPIVTTSTVTDITQTTAICGGNVTADGGSPVTERGICWSTSATPTISGSHLSSGAGLGAFTLQMTGLASNTTYHVRAYAKNAEKVGYGNDVEFHTLAPPPPTGAIAGLFTINNSGDKVYFSQGNLQYKASTNTWRFAESQFDYIGADNANISPTYNGWIDLFGWGTSGYHNEYDNFNVNYQPYSTSVATVNTGCNYFGYGPSTNMSDPNLMGTSAEYDWGVHNAISNGGDRIGIWRTLTADEWVYVLCTRSASTVGGIANARYVMATVNGISGIILFPDDYSHPAILPAPLYVNSPAEFANNSYSDNGWNTMENLGCVFLPASGCRYQNGTGTYIPNYPYYGLQTCGQCGLYWSTSYQDTEYSYHVGFRSGKLMIHYQIPEILPGQNGNYHFYWSSYGRHGGYSVRLVQDY